MPVETLRRAMRYTSVGLPGLAFLAAAFHAFAHNFAGNVIKAETFLVLASAYLGVYLFRRSKDREAAFATTRVKPSDDDAYKFVMDCAAMLIAACFLLGAIFLPLL